MTKIHIRSVKPRTATYYEVLGCCPGDSFETLHDAYLALARRLHPDAGGDAFSFAPVSIAWGVLRSPELRKGYDLKMKMERGICPRCNGRGLVSITRSFSVKQDVRCKTCEGKGYLCP